MPDWSACLDFRCWFQPHKAVSRFRKQKYKRQRHDATVSLQNIQNHVDVWRRDEDKLCLRIHFSEAKARRARDRREAPRFSTHSRASCCHQEGDCGYCVGCRNQEHFQQHLVVKSMFCGLGLYLIQLITCGGFFFLFIYTLLSLFIYVTAAVHCTLNFIFIYIYIFNGWIISNAYGFLQESVVEKVVRVKSHYFCLSK